MSTNLPFRRHPRRTVLRAAAAGLGAATLGPLAACSRDSTGADTPSAQSTVQVTLGAEIDGPIYRDGYAGPIAREAEPFHDGSQTFRIVVPQDAQVVGDWNKNKFTAWFEERTGVKVEFQAVQTLGPDGSQDLSKVNAMLASGDLPDAFMGIPFSGDQISLYGQQGVFAPIDGLIQSHAPALQQVMKDYPDLGPLLKSLDGHTYQFKALSDCYHCHVSPARALINKSYLDAVGASIPTTTDELRSVLIELRDNDPSGSGEFIPFAAGVDNPIDTFIMNSFLYNPGETAGWMRLNNGKVEFVADKPEWREGLRYLRTLFDDGTLAADAFTMTGEELLRAGNRGNIGFARVYFHGSIADVDDKPDSLWRDYVAVPPLTGPAGVQYAGWDYHWLTGPPFVITSSCSRPDVLVQWADAQLDLVAQLNAYAGTQDETWEWSAEGEPGLDGEQALWKSGQWPPPEGQGWSLFQIYYLSNDFRLAQYSDPQAPDLERALFDATEPYERLAQPKEFQLPELIFDESSAAQVADLQTTVASHVTQSMAKFATAELDINNDADWQAYLDELTAMGLADSIELHQQAYEKQPK